MFTDSPTTPLRVETLVELLRRVRGGLGRETLYAMLEPDGLPGKTASTAGAEATFTAAKELGLVKEETRVTVAFKSDAPTRTLVLEALDHEVLGKLEHEPHFAVFYAYLLGLDAAGTELLDRNTWAARFNADVFGDEEKNNPFNPTKLTALHRWFGYAGLGWYDSRDTFHCNPYERLRRRLPAIFGRESHIMDEVFMERLAKECPELDGGWIFERAHRGRQRERMRCTLGLAHALVELHLDGIVRLHCGGDSGGYSIEAAEPPFDGRYLRSARLDAIEFLGGDGGGS